MSYSNEEVKFELTKIGLKSKPPFICTNGDSGRSNRGRLVVLQNCETKEKLTRYYSNTIAGKNPWGKGFNPNLSKTINKIGIKSIPPFICINTNIGSNKYGQKLIEIQNCETKEKLIRTSQQIINGGNPWKDFFNKKSMIQDVKELTNIGLKSNPSFICLNAYIKKNKHGDRLVQIQNCQTKEKLIRTRGSIKKYQNPWHSNDNRIELLKVHPMYKKLFKNNKINYEYNFKLGKKIIDFAFEHSITKKWYGLEVKQSGRWHSEKGQISGYKRLASLKQYNLAGVILSDPKGSHKKKGSISIKELAKFLTK